MEYPYNLTKEEVIRKITEEYHSGYDLDNPNFDIYNQLLACESIAEAEEEAKKRSTYTHFQENGSIAMNIKATSENVSVNGNGNGTCKQRVNFELTQSKQNAILQLTVCNYATPPPEIASLLEIIFEGTNTIPGWWLAVAQQWNPRAIRRVVNQMLNAESSGWVTINNPAAYFTTLIKHRKKRRKTSINGTR